METIQYVPVSPKALEGLRQIARENKCTLAEAVEKVSIFNHDFLTMVLADALHKQLLRWGVDRSSLTV